MASREEATVNRLEKSADMTEKEKKVYKLLLTPIICDKSISQIFIQNGIIKSPQLYIHKKDEDMSNFSIGFYEIVYKDKLNEIGGGMLDDKGYLNDKEFAGDTMHSFNSLANIILGDKSKNDRSPIDNKWPTELVEYYSKYHCLANFWVIPMRHGRKSAKLSKYDSMDYYLEKVKDSFINYSDGYFGKFTNWESFLDEHCINDCVIKKNPLDIYKNNDKEGCKDELKRICDMWEKRANELVKKHGDELYDYFKKCKLV